MPKLELPRCKGGTTPQNKAKEADLALLRGAIPPSDQCSTCAFSGRRCCLDVFPMPGLKEFPGSSSA